MSARAHNPDVALMPIPFKECPSLGPAFSDYHWLLAFLAERNMLFRRATVPQVKWGGISKLRTAFRRLPLELTYCFHVTPIQIVESTTTTHFSVAPLGAASVRARVEGHLSL